jgi:parallel beta-helix repeat protein
MRTLVLAATLLCVLPVAAKTLNVGPGAQYTDIQTALDSASAGDVVKIAAGYYEVSDGVEVKANNVTLKGAGADQTILDGVGKAYAIVSANAQGVTVTGFTLTNAESHGFYVTGTNYGTLSYCVVTDCKDRGILLASGKPYAIIDHNTFANNKVSTIYSYRDDARTKFTNNISYDNGRSIVTDSTMSHMTIKYNCFYGGTNDSLPVRTSKTNFRADPLFVEPQSDFHLQEGSPCLGKGEKESNIGALGTGKNPEIQKPKKSKASAQYRVVVFANDQDLGEKVLGVIKAAGFANDESYVGDEPDEDAMIEYGAASADDVAAMHKLISVLYEDDIQESDAFEADDYDVFIYLP